MKKVDLGKREFDCKNPPITDAATLHLKTIKTLETLNLPADGLSDAGVANLAELKNLKELGLPLPHYVDSKLYLHPYTEKSIRELAKIRSLESLTLGGPGVTDAALSHVAQLTNLQSLMLYGCPISNEGIAKLVALQSLESLTLRSSSQLTISGLNALDGLSRLVHLHAHALGEDETPLNIGKLTRLEYLMLSCGKNATFHDRDLACLTNLKRLKWVQLGSLDLAITDIGLERLAGLIAMDRLILGGSGITDRGLASLTKMSKLDLLNIKGTFTDAGVQHLGGLKGLKHLTLSSANDFSPAAKERLRKSLPNLVRFTINQGQAIGEAPTPPRTPSPERLPLILLWRRSTALSSPSRSSAAKLWCCISGAPGAPRA